MKHLKDYEAARVEAEEEAGVIGIARKKPIGTFQYWKRLPDTFQLIEAVVYVVHVTAANATFKEMAVRRVQWMALEDAALVVDEPGFSALLRSYKPKAEKSKSKKSYAILGASCAARLPHW